MNQTSNSSSAVLSASSFSSSCNSSSCPSPMPPNQRRTSPKQRTYDKAKPVHTGNILTLKYEPMNGVQTASILGSTLFLVILYIFYKAKCKKSSWTSEDQVYLERYRQKVQHRNNNCVNRLSRASSKWSTGKDSVRESFALENTAKWIQSQPLNTAVPPTGSVKKPLKSVSNMCQVCIDPCHSTICPRCSNSDIQQVAGAEGGTPLNGGADRTPKCNNLPSKSSNVDSEMSLPKQQPEPPNGETVNLEKRIDVGTHNASPELHRAMKPKLKYLPLFTLPVTNISFIPSANVSPNTPLCISPKPKRKISAEERGADHEGLSLKEMGRGLRFIDSYDEVNDEEQKQSLALSVSKL